MVLGKKGSLTALLKGVSKLPKDQRPLMGQAVNEAKRELGKKISKQQDLLQQALLEKQLKSETLDTSLPGLNHSVGSVHPVTQVKYRVISLFSQLGFSVAEGPEIEDDYHNFTALNIPEYHPARALQDTFYLTDGQVLRTHTSPVQIRVMESQSPPIRIITPGRVFRCDSDQTHTPCFTSVKGY